MAKVVVVTPAMDTIHIMHHIAVLQLKRDSNTAFDFALSSLIYDARNILASRAIKFGHERVLWLDSDMTFEPDLINRLSARIDEGYDMVSGIYIGRKPTYPPCIYKDIIPGSHAVPYTDYPKDSMFEIAGCGFGGVIMKTELIQEVGEKFGYPFSPIVGLGEDLSFCYRVAQLGKKIYCDSSIKLGHIGYKEFRPE